MPYSTVELQYDEAVVTLTLNRPERRNAISAEMVAELPQALGEIERSPARVVILTGAGTAFCAGMDLKYLQEFHSRSSDQLIEDSRRIAAMLRRLWSFPKATVAAVNGPAIAGGTGIATVCDFTLATPEARFGYTEVRIGFIPAIVSSFVIRQLGDKKARELFLSGRLLNAREAQGMGLVNEIVSQEKLLPRARELAAELVALSPTALAHTKRLLVKLTEKDLDREIELAIQESVQARLAADFREGLAAFLEKRKPVWRGE